MKAKTKTVTAVDEAQALLNASDHASEEDLRALREGLAKGRAAQVVLQDTTRR